MQDPAGDRDRRAVRAIHRHHPVAGSRGRIVGSQHRDLGETGRLLLGETQCGAVQYRLPGIDTDLDVIGDPGMQCHADRRRWCGHRCGPVGRRRFRSRSVGRRRGGGCGFGTAAFGVRRCGGFRIAVLRCGGNLADLRAVTEIHRERGGAGGQCAHRWRHLEPGHQFRTGKLNRDCRLVPTAVTHRLLGRDPAGPRITVGRREGRTAQIADIGLATGDRPQRIGQQTLQCRALPGTDGESRRDGARIRYVEGALEGAGLLCRQGQSLTAPHPVGGVETAAAPGELLSQIPAAYRCRGRCRW